MNAAQRNKVQARDVDVTPAVSDERTTPNRPQIANINNRMPAFPCVVIVFSKIAGNLANQVLTFSDQATFDTFRVQTVGAVRVIQRMEDLADVPTPVLLSIFNRTRADAPLDRFRDRTSAETRVMDVLGSVATPYEEPHMSDATQAEAKTKAEAKAQDRKAQKEEKQRVKDAAKADAKAKREEARAGGVIGTIRSMLETDTGATQAEILDVLATKFPDRKREGMSSTVKIQTSRLAKTLNRKINSANIEGRGRVYKFDDKGTIPGKVVVEQAPAATAAEPKADLSVADGGKAKGKGKGKGKGAETPAAPAAAAGE